ncbi:SAF domain-containing protein [Nocardiopsis sp. NRRL B-16309]|uniref:SAF domain-containing protein n=1 Tax=Nocardiopsis sp. NRRL B-16309 TaxID=1519494 RepID=UPI0006AE28ED|nr:SAF domain-containing protein [Nocardiopsis sp. NRRL B-16309]
MAAGAAAVVLALGQLDQRMPVVVAAQDLPAGHVITAADLRVVDLAGAEALPVISDVTLAVGATTTLPVTEGAFLSESVLGSDGEQLSASEAAVGTVLSPARVPSSLRAGGQVSVVLTGGDAGASAVPARVQDLTPLGDDPGAEVRVELVVEASQAARVARAAAEDGVSLVQVPHQDGGTS